VEEQREELKKMWVELGPRGRGKPYPKGLLERGAVVYRRKATAGSGAAGGGRGARHQLEDAGSGASARRGNLSASRWSRKDSTSTASPSA
jgi:hypothetical protein